MHGRNIGRTAASSGGFRTSLPCVNRLTGFDPLGRGAGNTHYVAIPAKAEGCPGTEKGCSVLIGTNPKVVMRGLDPRIHAVACVVGDRCADVDCIVVSPSKDGGRRRALRTWVGLDDRGHLGPAGVAV